MNWMARRRGRIWNVNIAGYWGEGYTQLEAVHHARFKLRLNRIIQRKNLLKHDTEWDKYPYLIKE